MGGTTSDPSDPGLKDIDPDTGMQRTYLVMGEEELAEGFIRPVRTAYIHLECGGVTVMGEAIAMTYARDPLFYGGTYCTRCGDHFPVGEHGEFVWSVPRKDTPIGEHDKVGT